MSSLKVADLRKKAKECGVVGFAKMKKNDLLLALDIAASVGESHSVCPAVCDSVCPAVCDSVCPAVCDSVCPAETEPKKPDIVDWNSIKATKTKLIAFAARLEGAADTSKLKKMGKRCLIDEIVRLVNIKLCAELNEL